MVLRTGLLGSERKYWTLTLQVTGLSGTEQVTGLSGTEQVTGLSGTEQVTGLFGSEQNCWTFTLLKLA